MILVTLPSYITTAPISLTCTTAMTLFCCVFIIIIIIIIIGNKCGNVKQSLMTWSSNQVYLKSVSWSKTTRLPCWACHNLAHKTYKKQTKIGRGGGGGRRGAKGRQASKIKREQTQEHTWADTQK
jgi:hypothetical protein